ncbi:uncharacterized protein KIAA1143 homolog [Macrobrachium rosenbergii]|uniref:uncharacterized protein KIAA1143 homolog n=1 Tax=Macrobrachium rosenbergii TaxID=79674 RepID=UPI0034D50458
MAGWTGKRTNVMYTKPEEPSFLKKFKERVGYKEDGGLSDKFAVMPKASDDDCEDKDDELPQVVSLRPGDLTQEEYDKLRAEGKLDDLLQEKSESKDSKCKEEEPPPDGKIIFRKPTKRTSEEGQKEDGKKLKSDKSEKEMKKKNKQKIKLLSFNEDEEEEED